MPRLWGFLALFLTGLFGTAALILVRSNDPSTAQAPFFLAAVFAVITYDCAREAIR